jgi:S1-C subfamily serine protease
MSSSFSGRASVAALIAIALVGCHRVDRSKDHRASQSPEDTSTPSSAPTVLPPLPPATPIQPLPATARLDDENNTISVFKAVAPSVVFVTQNRVVADWMGSEREVPAGSGSGFVWDDQGDIVTNFHVVDGAQSLTVTLQGSKAFDAKVVGIEPHKDVAVIRIEAPKDLLVPIHVLPAKQEVEVGQKAIAIGNPFGLDHTLTTGVISAVGRPLEGAGGVTIRDMIQTDASINPGNSGGPLLDSTGRLIGMNTAIFSRSGQSAGIGFAVPASTIERVVPELIAKGHVEQVGIGINIDPGGRIARRLGVKGVVVLDVQKGSPADKAGIVGLKEDNRDLTINDIIVAVDGQPTPDYDALYQVFDGHKAGDTVKVTLLRGDDKRTVSIQLVTLEPD